MPITIKLATGQTVKTIASTTPIMKPPTGAKRLSATLPPNATEAANDHAPVTMAMPPMAATPMPDLAQEKAAITVTAPSYPLPAIPPKTLGDLKRHLEPLAATGQAKEIPLLLSAINAVTRKFPGTSPDDHPCDPALLRQRLASVPCAEQDKPYWSSTRSRLRRALTIAGLDVMPGKRRHKLAPAWQALWEKLPQSPWTAALSRFFGFCAAQGFTPEDMCDAIADRFLHALETTSLRGRPLDIQRGAIRGWNNAVEQVEGWPQLRLTLPEIPSERSVLYADEFTPAFQAALKAHIAYLADPPEDDDDAPFKALSPTTLKAREFHLRQIASALIEQGIPREQLNGLADLVSKDKLNLLCAYLSARHGRLATSIARNLLQIYAGLARFQAHDLALAKQIGKRLRAKIIDKLPPKGMTQKNRRRIAQFGRPEVVHHYTLLPLILRQKAKGIANNPRRAAVLMRAAVVLELEMMCPLRLANVASLTLSKHLLPYTSGKKKTNMRLFIPGSEVKNGEDIELALPDTLVGLIEDYLYQHRKALVKPQFRHGQPIHLFPTPEGKAKSGKVLAESVCETLQAELGIEFNFHLFRHIGCYLYLKRCPGDYETMRRVLAHRNIETTARFYAEMQKEEAFRTFDRVILELRDGHQVAAPKPAKPKAAAVTPKQAGPKVSTPKPGNTPSLSSAEAADVL